MIYRPGDVGTQTQRANDRLVPYSKPRRRTR